MNSDNPFQSPQSSSENSLPQLGDLAQSSRENELGQAKGTLIVIGLLTMAINGFMFANAENEIADLNVPNPGDVVAVVRVIYGAAFLLGLALLTCGCLVKTWPVPMTITGLTLYLLGTAGFALLNPSGILQGIIFKVIVVVLLVKSIKTAFAYERDRHAGIS